MTAREPRAACCVCFRAFPEPGQLKCPDCDSAPARQARALPIERAKAALNTEASRAEEMPAS
jgi:hypothetical protein